ncbi:MAG: energy transducer TonB [Deltaproteobacteria bacterium]|nr:energy transducer TonB [Deltaproteobacteria bacterium]
MRDAFFPGDSARGPAVWLAAILTSLTLHSVLLAAACWWKSPARPKPKRIVPIEAITLTGAGLYPGGGGSPGPAAKQVKSGPEKRRPKVSLAHTKAVPRKKTLSRRKSRPRKRQTRVTPPQDLPLPPTLVLPRPASAGRASPSSALFGSSAAASAITCSSPGQGRGKGTGAGGGAGSGIGRGQGRGRGPGAGGSLLKHYLSQIRFLLEQNKYYPRQARRLHQEGVAVLQFTLNSAGQVQGVRVSRSSGHKLLDQAALKTLSRVGRFPSFPPALNRKQLTVEIPLDYRLE